ncbi:Mannitol 2-dehydrogenase [Globisporangium polare]
MENVAHHNGVRQTEVSNASKSSMSSASMANGGDRYTEGKLPLSDDFFKVPSLSAKESKYLVGLAKRACKEVVYYSRKTDGPMKWVHLSSEDGIELCQGIDESSSSETRSLIYLRGATKIYATIDEIADFFRLDTPEKLGGFAQTVGKDIMDQKTLYTLATPTAENPKHYVGAKWTAIESPSKLARNRDFCYLECHDEFIDTNSKKRGWVRSVHSIRLPFCPQLDRSHGLVRGSLYRSGFIFIESNEKGCVDAIHTLHMDVKGNSPNWIKVLAMKRRIKNIAQVNKYFQLHRLTQGKLLGDLELPAKAGVTRCQVCESKFKVFNRKWRCRKCGKVICTSCGHSYIIDYAGAGPKKVRVCMGCSEAVVFGKFDDGPPGVRDGRDAKQIKQVKQINDADFKPIYDPSPMSGDDDSGFESRHLSVEEHDYYLENEDQRGIADMMEAKRMQQEFENHMKHSAGPVKKQKQNERIEESMSGVTLPTDSPPSQWDPEVDGAVYEDAVDDDDDELGLPRGKNEQQQKLYEELLRQQQMKYEQQKELRTATQTVSHQQPNRSAIARTSSQRRSSKEEERYRLLNGSLLDQQDPFYQRLRHMEQQSSSGGGGNDNQRKDSLESIRISSDWGNEHTSSTELLHNNTYGSGGSHLSGNSYLSATGGPVRRSDLSVESSRASFVREHSMDSSSSVHHPQHPMTRSSFASSTQDDYIRHQHHYNQYDEDHRRVSAEYAAQHSFHGAAGSPLVAGNNGGVLRRKSSGERGQQHYDTTSAYRREQSHQRYTDMADDSSNSVGGRDSAYESPMSSFHRRNGVASSEAPSTTRYSPQKAPAQHHHRSMSGGLDPEMARRYQSRTEMSDREELAHYMALSAMKLFEMERGPDLQVPDDVRQAALSKMMAVYANEIERSSGAAGMMDRRAYNAQTRYGSTPQQTLRRSVSEARREPFRQEAHRLPSEMVGGARYERSPIAPLGRSESYELGYLQQHKSSPATLQARSSSHERYQDVRDLSEMSSSAFKDYQIHSEGATPAGHSKSIEKSVVNSSGLRRNDSFMGRPTAQQAAALRGSLGSSRQSLKMDDMARPDLRARLSGTTLGSVTSSDARQSLSRQNSIYEDAESDTFSELDFVELPHLMRKDYVPPPTPGSDDRSSGDTRFPLNSFTDVHQWQQEEVMSSPLDMGHMTRDSIYHEGVERRLSELNPDEHIFHQGGHDGFSSQSDGLRDSLSIASSPTRQSGNLVTELPPSASGAFAPEYSLGSSKQARADSDSSSSYSSDEPDYVTEETIDLPATRSQMSLSELERYRASLAELMSDYSSNDRQSLTDSSAGDRHMSFGSGFYNPLAQPEREPEYHRHNGYARRQSVDDEEDDDAAIKPTNRSVDGMLREMYI